MTTRQPHFFRRRIRKKTLALLLGTYSIYNHKFCFLYTADCRIKGYLIFTVSANISPVSAVYAVAQVVSRWHLTLVVQVQQQASPCGICGGHKGTETGFFPATLIFPCQYHSTNAPYSFIHLPLMLYDLNNYQCC
jgi:hypothetical protein